MCMFFYVCNCVEEEPTIAAKRFFDNNVKLLRDRAVRVLRSIDLIQDSTDETGENSGINMKISRQRDTVLSELTKLIDFIGRAKHALETEEAASLVGVLEQFDRIEGACEYIAT